MQSDSGNLIVYNGEIYNYKELKKKLEKFFISKLIQIQRLSLLHMKFMEKNVLNI